MKVIIVRDSVRGDTLLDVQFGEGLEKLGSFTARYPEICPVCFSKYPDDPAQRREHIGACARLLQEIKEG